MIIAISDLHINRLFSARLAKKLLLKIKLKRPEAIFVLGDLVDFVNDLAYESVEMVALDFFRGLADIAPVYLVYGNHDSTYKVSGSRKEIIPTTFRSALAAIPNLAILSNSFIETDNFFIAGFEPSFAYYHPAKKPSEPAALFSEELKTFLETLPSLPDKPSFFLTHSPINGDILISNLKNFDHILTGHMHNGCLPKWLLWLPGHRGLIGPDKRPFPDYARGKVSNLTILPPISTFPNHLFFLQPLYPRYISEIKLKNNGPKKLI